MWPWAGVVPQHRTPSTGPLGGRHAGVGGGGPSSVRRSLSWSETIQNRNVKRNLDCYHPQTKLQEGNVFADVCLSFLFGGPHMTITHDTSGHGYPSTLPLPQIPDMRPATDIWWSSLKTCSNLFTWGPTPRPPLTFSGGHQNNFIKGWVDIWKEWTFMWFPGILDIWKEWNFIFKDVLGIFWYFQIERNT